MQQHRTTRRSFIKTTLGLTGIVSFPYIVPAFALGSHGASVPSQRINLGLIGTGNINGHHREVFLAEKDTRIVAVCDPVTARRETFRKRINEVYQDDVCKDYRDFRELLARPDIDPPVSIVALIDAESTGTDCALLQSYCPSYHSEM